MAESPDGKAPPYTQFSGTATPAESEIGLPQNLANLAAKNGQFRRLRLFRVLVVTQLVCSAAFLALGISGVVSEKRNYDYTGYYTYRWSTDIGTGIWVGVFCVLAAAFGAAAAAKAHNRCLLMAFFVLTIVAVALFIPCLVIFSSVGLDNERWNSRRLERAHMDWLRDEKNKENPSRTNSYYTSQVTYEEYDVRRLEVAGFKTINAMGLILCFVHMASAITSLSLVCFNWAKGSGGCCGCCGSGGEGGGVVVYVAPGTDPQTLATTLKGIAGAKIVNM